MAELLQHLASFIVNNYRTNVRNVANELTAPGISATSLHATQHRSEGAVLLTSYGQSPGDFDFTLFLNEQRAQGKS
jgi:hypothetical protein